MEDLNYKYIPEEIQRQYIFRNVLFPQEIYINECVSNWVLRRTREFRFPSFSCMYIYTRRTETGLRDPTPKIQIFTPWDRICLFIFSQFLFCYKYKIELTHCFRFFLERIEKKISLFATNSDFQISVNSAITIWNNLNAKI